MNCKNCGAPLTLFRDQDYFFCEYCASFYFPTPSQDGIRVLGDNPEGLSCPVCQLPLQMITLENYFKGFQCHNCLGFLFDMITFRNTIQYRRAKANVPPDPPKRIDQEALNRELHCPSCTQLMSTHPYLGPGAIVIDTCSTCRLIWLDYGELKTVENAPGKDRGIGWRSPEDVTKRDHQGNLDKHKVDYQDPQDILSLLGKFFHIDD
jgi:Zn-finger nucleic acid-binding protein